jgi:hypothetical protein
MAEASAGESRPARPVPWRHRALYAMLALLLTVLLYGNALTLPLFSDDLVQIPWLQSISWQELWTGPSPYGYYRPLWYSLWRVCGSLFGGLTPSTLHALNLIAHFAASALVGTLAATWIRGDSGSARNCAPGLVATAVFATFPFARQAIAWPGAVYNPIVAALAAGAVLSYDEGRRRSQARWIILASFLCLLAAFHYEAGLLTAPLVFVVEVIGRTSRRWKKRGSWWPLLFLALFPATLVVWQHMRGAGAGTFGLRPQELVRNAGLLLQALVYPVAPLAQLLAGWTGIGSLCCLWLVALPAAALLVRAALRSSRPALFLALGWLGLFALPPLIAMEADWFELAPRFLYTIAPGVALAWAAALAPLAGNLRTGWSSLVTALVVMALLLPAAIFVRQGVALYVMAGEAIWAAVDAATENHPLLLVNLPMRITPSGRLYPLGFEGITPLPQGVTGSQLVYVHTGIADGAEAAAFGVVATDDPAAYSYELLGPFLTWDEIAAAVRRNSAAFVAQYEHNRVRLLEAGSVLSGFPHPDSVAFFGGQVELLAATPSCDHEGTLGLEATWRARGSVQTNVTVFAHALDENGALLAQADGDPLLGMLPFRLWEPGDTVRDARQFGSLPPGEYTLILGLWDPASGDRWTVDDRGADSVSLSITCLSTDH